MATSEHASPAAPADTESICWAKDSPVPNEVVQRWRKDAADLLEREKVPMDADEFFALEAAFVALARAVAAGK